MRTLPFSLGGNGEQQEHDPTSVFQGDLSGCLMRIECIGSRATGGASKETHATIQVGGNSALDQLGGQRPLDSGSALKVKPTDWQMDWPRV